MSDYCGFVILDKPSGVTSFDLVSLVRRQLAPHLRGKNKLKVGHSGTLDPLATGLMLLAVGSATKFLEFLVGCDKEYEVVARFGFISDTYDEEGEVTQFSEVQASDVSIKKIEQVIEENFVGKIQQVPPKYSALKINGKKACDLVREGKEVVLKARETTVGKFEILDSQIDDQNILIKFIVQCSSGTYVRSLVHDLGLKLGFGAYVTELRRTELGVLKINDKRVLFSDSDLKKEGLLPLEFLLEQFSSYEISDKQKEMLSDGRKVSVENFEDADFTKKPVIALYKGKVIAVLFLDDGFVRLKKLV